MRSSLFIASIFFLVLSACGQKTSNSAEQEPEQVKPIPIVDLNAAYPQKELPVQELGKVRYIRLDTSDKALLGDEMSLVPTQDGLFFYHFSSGDIVGFDPDGKLLTAFNHKGQGANEYTNVHKVAFDKENGEVFILTQGRGARILGFDLSGKALHSYRVPDTLATWNMVSLNKDALLVWDMRNTPPVLNGQRAFDETERPAPNPAPFALLSKSDGSILNHLPLSINKRFKHFIMTQVDGSSYVYISQHNSLTPYEDGFILNEYTSDTTFLVHPDETLEPMFVRTPPVQSDLLKGKLCELLALTDRYMCLRTISLNTEEAQPGVGLKEKLLLLERENGSNLECTLRDQNHQGTGGVLPRPVTANNKLYFTLYPHLLKEALQNKSLSGELETLARSLDEDDNVVLMEVTLSSDPGAKR